jgi:hypothetical protein
MSSSVPADNSPFPSGHRRSFLTAAVPWLLAITVVTTIVIVIRVLVGSTGRVVPGFRRLHNRDLTWLVLVGLVSGVALLGAFRRTSVWRRLAISSLIPLTILGLALIARETVPTWPVGDGALIELYTMNAGHGTQFLGAYSQYGWHHPGPLLFYLLLPLYVLGGGSVAALDSGALVVNLGSMAIVAWVLLRRTKASSALIALVLAALLIYLLRLPSLLTSAWNPHVALLPFAALLILSAAVISGEPILLPLVAFYASFVTQTHVAFAPVSAALMVLTCVVTGISTRRHAERRRALICWGIVSVGVLEAVWLLPVAEQLTTPTGNMTRILRFFFADGGPGQSPLVAWSAWSRSVVAGFAPDLTPPQGWPFAGPPGTWPLVAATASVSGLLPVAVWTWRRRDSFSCALAVVCLLASAVGLWSVLRIKGTIGDYQVFWLSIVGLLNIALLIGVLLPCGIVKTTRIRSLGFSVAVPIVFVIGMASIGLQGLVAARGRSDLDQDNVAVRNLTQQIFERRRIAENRRPLIRFDSAIAGAWSVEAGLVLQLVKASVPVTVDPSAGWLFGQRFLMTGDEDALWTVCGVDLHRELTRRPNNVILAEDSDVHVFVDAISLVNAPQYRPNTGQSR